MTKTAHKICATCDAVGISSCPTHSGFDHVRRAGLALGAAQEDPVVRLAVELCAARKELREHSAVLAATCIVVKNDFDAVIEAQARLLLERFVRELSS